MDDAGLLRELTDPDLRRLRGMLDERSLTTFTHAPFFGLDIASVDAGISTYSMQCIERALAAAAALGAPVAVMHTAYLPFFSRSGRRLWFRNWADRMPRIVARAADLGVTIAFENTWEDRPEILVHLLDLLPGAAAGVCLDTGHLNVFSRIPLRRWWERLGDRVIALHVHDNDGMSDDHLVPGSGTFDFGALGRLVRGMRRPPLISFEVPLPNAAQGRRYFQELLGAE
jgi:sugar phosphate isomerase/epimerase